LATKYRRVHSEQEPGWAAPRIPDARASETHRDIAYADRSRQKSTVLFKIFKYREVAAPAETLIKPLKPKVECDSRLSGAL
jgi:hypothetical protein